MFLHADSEDSDQTGQTGSNQSSHQDFENRTKNAVFQKKLGVFTILYYEDVSKSWSQGQKVGVKYTKFGVNQNSGNVS